MSYRKYATECVVLGGVDVGESDRYISLFTRDFGYVGVYASGVRKLSSKLRYSLQTFSYTDVEVIRGRHMWRITNATTRAIFSGISSEEGKTRVAARVVFFLKRFFAGEEFSGEIFDDIVAGLRYLDEVDMSSSELYRFEVAMMAKILAYLGYIKRADRHHFVFSGDVWCKDYLDRIEDIKHEIVSEINSAIKHSHL